jgi:hypothetical protein
LETPNSRLPCIIHRAARKIQMEGLQQVCGYASVYRRHHQRSGGKDPPSSSPCVLSCVTQTGLLVWGFSVLRVAVSRYFPVL